MMKLCVKVWFSIRLTISVLNKDFEIVRALITYISLNRVFSKTASMKFIQHLLYLNEEIVVVVFVHQKISLDIKKKMVRDLKE